METKKQCRVQPRQYQSQQKHLIGHLRKRPDFLHGVSIDSETAAKVQSNDGTLSCVKNSADIFTPTYEMKWDPTEKDGPARWNTKNMDSLSSWIRGHHKLLRGHTGVWSHDAIPSWVNQLDGPQHKEALKKAIYDHVYYIVKRYGKQMIAFDVINEPFTYSSDGTFQDSVFWRNLGYEYIVIAFQAANKAKWELQSNVKLYVNEMAIEGTYGNNGKKVQAMLNLIDKLKSLGVNFQGIGLQGHLNVYDFPNDLAQGIKRFTDKGLEVSITELDIRKKANDNSEETLNKQAWQYAHVYDACLSNKQCKAIIRWNVDDDHSWIPQGIPGWNGATLFGSKCAVKSKAFNAVSKVLAKYA